MVADSGSPLLELLSGSSTIILAGAAFAVLARVVASALGDRLTAEKARVSGELEAKLPPDIRPPVRETAAPEAERGSLINVSEVAAGATVVITQNPITSDKRFGLQKDYYSETLAQARVSFRLSAVAAALGFMLIVVAVVIALFVQSEGVLQDARTTLPVIGAVVAEAVAALFVSQWRAAQSAMGVFFEGFTRDRRLDESLALAYQISDDRVRSATQSSLAMALLDLEPGRVEHLIDGLRSLAGSPAADGCGPSDGRARANETRPEDGAGGAAFRPGEAPA